MNSISLTRRRILKSSLLMALVLFYGCTVDGDLIDEIQSSDDPDRFKSKDVSQIVARYVPLGTEKQEALRRLRSQNLDVVEVKTEILDCPNCDLLSVSASHVQKHAISFLPDKSYISLLFGFRDEKVAYLAASQSGNPF